MPTIYTIGHSTRPAQEFCSILRAFAIHTLVDIRSVPRSRKNPQYNQDEMPAWLRACGAGYVHSAGLGGLRRAARDSPNGGWRNNSFRGYADYMQSAPFAAAIGQLIGYAEQHTVAIMCAEAVPWRCHRSLVADALLIRGIEVQHIMSENAAKPHALTPFAKVDGLRITYPG